MGLAAGRRDRQNHDAVTIEGVIIQDRDNAEQRHSTPKSDQRAQDQNGAQRAQDRSSFSAQQLFRLQRAAGNRATTAAVNRATQPQQQVQRAVGEDVEGGREKTGGGLDFAGGQIGHWAGGGAFGSMPKPGGGGDDLAYKYGNTTTGGAGGGAAGGIIGGIGGIGSTVLSSISAEKARKTKAAETGSESEATWRAADRQQKTSVTNAVSSSVGVGGTAVGTTAAFSQIASNLGSTSAFAGLNNLLGGIAGIIALPIQALSTARTVRKAAKQWTRVTELRKQVTNPEANEAQAKAALKAHQDLIPALESVKNDAETELAEVRARQTAINDGLLRERGRKTKDQVEIGRLEAQLLRVTGEIPTSEQLALQAQAAVDAARVEETRLDTAKTAAEQAVRDAHDRIATGKEGPDEIAAYALNKNKSGFFKKIASAVGGFLGIGGGIAATVASFAAIGATTVVGTAVIATPVGWALCGAAALVALGLGGFAFWKWASKRYGRARTQEGMSKGKAFLAAINPFKKVGTSNRERLALRLYDYAAGNDGTPADMAKAKETLKALGLNFDTLKMGDPRHKDASLKLIHDKMAS